jgi:hypothetical protein
MMLQLRLLRLTDASHSIDRKCMTAKCHLAGEPLAPREGEGEGGGGAKGEGKGEGDEEGEVEVEVEVGISTSDLAAAGSPRLVSGSGSPSLSSVWEGRSPAAAAAGAAVHSEREWSQLTQQ